MRLAFSNLIISAVPIVRRLREHHFEAFFVGGAVRDTVLGLPIKDIDIATSARPEQVLELFEHCIPTGLQHGTITVMDDGIGYEVTTFRQESAYEDHRKPESVRYITDLDGDLLRRDFTMNAMALAEDGELHDPYGGLQDLTDKKLRSVGDSNARFQEDALRMIRAVRFIGVYHLTPTLGTWRALKQHRPLLRFIAMERVQAELDKMLMSKSPQRALHFVIASGLLSYLKEPLWDETNEALMQAQLNMGQMKELFLHIHELDELDLRFAAVAIGLQLAVPAVQQAMQVFRFSNARTKTIVDITTLHTMMFSRNYPATSKEQQVYWIHLVLRFGTDTASHWLAVISLLPTHKLRLPDDHLSRLKSWMDRMVVYKLKQLSVSGKELCNDLDREAGPWVSHYLNRLLLLVASGELKNEKSILLQRASEWE
ncbi:CCA tRNA nucleotidyltransferase [Paenibacillus sinopodophylli]|uniref:CCA tRNA nucleotidyltransferase n=1 Tax=Paenibacillus sinopodophylli TaxID=1837342 RepID=UPI001485CC07|nr:CCA tRNA nucleotidyltransferase [Paenibacillus sinopodophylli]